MVGCQPHQNENFLPHIATSPPSVAPQDDSRPIPDHLIPNA